MKRIAMAVSLAAAACQRNPQATGGNDSAGARLERAAIATGLTVDPASRSIVGAWARDSDRACIVPGQGRDSRIGILIDYGLGQGCVASGSVRRIGDVLNVGLGECRLAARFDGIRIIFPPEVSPACDQLCTGRVSLAAMTVERQSESVSEARSLRAPSGRPLCAS